MIVLIQVLIKIKNILIDLLRSCIRIMLLVVLIPNILIHELGHLTAALILGVQVQSFEIGEGDIVYETTFLGIPFRVHELPVGGGLVVNSAGKMYADWQVIVLLATGFLANLTVGIICFWSINNFVGWIYGGINVVFAICSMWPSSDSDGYRCYQVLTGKVSEDMEKV